MKLKNPMLVVRDIDQSVEFYNRVFGLHVIMDFGANKTLTGGLALQTAETYQEFIGDRAISLDRKSTRLNSSHILISYAVFCLKKKT